MGCGSGNFPGGGVIPFNGVPTGTCGNSQLAMDTTNGFLYSCVNGHWIPIACGCGGGGGGGANYMDGIVLLGSGTSWSVPIAPNPVSSLQIYQMIVGFGSILLISGIDYTLSGTAVTTTNTIAAGSLRAWYRY